MRVVKIRSSTEITVRRNDRWLTSSAADSQAIKVDSVEITSESITMMSTDRPLICVDITSWNHYDCWRIFATFKPNLYFYLRSDRDDWSIICMKIIDDLRLSLNCSLRKWSIGYSRGRWKRLILRNEMSFGVCDDLIEVIVLRFAIFVRRSEVEASAPLKNSSACNHRWPISLSQRMPSVSHHCLSKLIWAKNGWYRGDPIFIYSFAWFHFLLLWNITPVVYLMKIIQIKPSSINNSKWQ